MAAESLPERLRQGIRAQELALLEKGRRINFRRIRERVLYSRFLFAPGKGGIIEPGTYQLFVTTQGNTGQGYAAPITERETNWPQTGKLSSQQNLVVRRIFTRIMRGPSDLALYPENADVDPFIPLHAQDLAAVARGMQLAIKYVTEVVPMGLLSDFPAPGGVFGFSESSRQAPGSVFGVATAGISGSPDLSGGLTPQIVQAYGQHPIAALQTVPRWMRQLNVPLMIGASEQFTAELQVYEPIQLLGAAPLEQASSIFRFATGCVEVEVGLWCTESFDEQS